MENYETVIDQIYIGVRNEDFSDCQFQYTSNHMVVVEVI